MTVLYKMSRWDTMPGVKSCTKRWITIFKLSGWTVSKPERVILMQFKCTSSRHKLMCRIKNKKRSEQHFARNDGCNSVEDDVERRQRWYAILPYAIAYNPCIWYSCSYSEIICDVRIDFTYRLPINVIVREIMLIIITVSRKLAFLFTKLCRNYDLHTVIIMDEHIIIAFPICHTF